ncbi:MAG TPA: hypothetical protein DCR93_12410 [Cytophagales bacterium]|nr:hypothetical protein [Cytophagales bacterium]HAP60250.1 hypothetical protein [Cytophagales bacterium]
MLVALASCGLADVRPEAYRVEPTEEQVAKGKALLDEAWEAQGLDKLAEVETYEVIASDHWPGMMGRMGDLWPWERRRMALRYIPGTFDAQVESLEGEYDGTVYGLQSWQYYAQEPGKEVEFLEEGDDRITFGLAAFQYFFELADRLKRTDQIAYAGSLDFGGTTYEVVMVSWGDLAPQEDVDQYRLLIHPETKRIEWVTYTIRDNYLPAPASLYGTIHFEDFREVEGIWFSYKQSVYLNENASNPEKYAHQLTVRDIRLNAVSAASLRPGKNIVPVGDDKPLANP